jgi:3-dehydroquinate synthase
MTETVPVKLDNRSYDIHVGAGLLSRAGALIAPFARGIVPVVTDRNVARLHAAEVLASLKAANLDTREIVLDPGEATKSFAGLERLSNTLLEMGIERGGLIVALGGGVIGDLTGFAAGVLKRGIDFAQIPTTLLAQVDSSVGGKTAINTPQGKNLVGLFYQPRVVIADTAVLSTLPPRELRAGYAEVAKYGALGDVDFFAWLEKNGPKVLEGDAASRVHAVAHSCRMKAAIVARDEREAGDRALLNLGHTFGHALEAATGYSDRLLHGEGVAVGMALAFRLSVRLGLCPAHDATRLEAHLRQVGLPASIAEIPGERPVPALLMEHMAHDKKASGGKLTFILVRGLGKAFTTNDVPPDAVRDILAA